MSLYPLGERIDCFEKEAVPVSILRKRSCGVNAPAKEGRCSLVDPTQLLQWWWRNSVLLQCHAVTYTIAHVLVHAGPPELLADLAEQLVAAAVSQVLVDIH